MVFWFFGWMPSNRVRSKRRRDAKHVDITAAPEIKVAGGGGTTVQNQAVFGTKLLV
jgi:hypothetical protein